MEMVTLFLNVFIGAAVYVVTYIILAMEEVIVTTERGVEKTTTLKNGDILVEVSAVAPGKDDIPTAQHYYINNEAVDRVSYLSRLRQS